MQPLLIRDIIKHVRKGEGGFVVCRLSFDNDDGDDE